MSERKPAGHIIPVEEVKRERIAWLWEPYMQAGNITVLRGDPGVGKTYFIAAIMAALAADEQPQGMPGTLHKNNGRALYFGVEDAPATIRARIESAGAVNLNGLYISPERITFKDADRIREMVADTGADLLIFDPIQAYLGAGVDMNRANEIRPLMDNLRAIAKDTGCAVLIIEHKNKNQKGDDLYRGIGSMDITAAARSVLTIVRDIESRNRRYTMQIKTNAKEAKAAAWLITDGGVFKWLGDADKTQSDIESAQEASRVPAIICVREIMDKHPNGWRGTAGEMIEACGISKCGINSKQLGHALNDHAVIDTLYRFFNISVSVAKGKGRSFYNISRVNATP